MYYAFALIGLAVLIVVHEAGHMWVARLCGMRVDRFSIFFGPALLKWRGKKTTYQIAAIPLGGYVQIAGMNPQEVIAPDDPAAYHNKAAWKRFLTIFAGPAINYLCAIVFMIVVTLVWGLPAKRLEVARVVSGSPAAAAGMQPGDKLVRVNGRAVRSVEDILKAIQASGGRAVNFAVRRSKKTVLVKPQPTLSRGSYRIGIEFGSRFEFAPVGVSDALRISAIFPFRESQKVLRSLGKLFQKKSEGGVGVDKVGGPIEIVRQLKSSFQAGFAMALVFLAMLNVYLGLFNLLPIPALDGGRLVFLTFEILARRPINRRIENTVHTLGFVLLLAIFLLVTIGDVRRLFG